VWDPVSKRREDGSSKQQERDPVSNLRGIKEATGEGVSKGAGEKKDSVNNMKEEGFS
jgi:hypothetical protein